MNMQRPHGFELYRPIQKTANHDQIIDDSKSKPGVRHLLWPIAGCGVIYLLAQASVWVVLTTVGVVAAVIGVATAVCIYAQNNTW